MSYDSSLDDRFDKREHFLEMLLKVTNDLATSKSLDDALGRLVNLTTSTINAERGTIFLNDASTGELYSYCTGQLRSRDSHSQHQRYCGLGLQQ